MKHLIIYVAAVVFLSVSSFSFAMSDLSKAMSYNLVCYGAYHNTGQTKKAKEKIDLVMTLASVMTKREVADAKRDALNIVYTSKANGFTSKQVADMCDKFDKGDK